MYQVMCDNNVIYDLRIENLKIISPKLSMEVNKTGSFSFTITEKNPGYDLIKKMKSIITIYQDGKELWRGRVLNDKLDFYNRKQVECEGELAFLLDSVQRPYTFQGSPKELFENFINNHNTQVEKEKQFKVRNVSVKDNNNYINRENSNYSNVWDSINDKLIDLNGGYLETGDLNGEERYIDYIEQYKNLSNQTIQFGENLLDLTQYIKGENIKTAIIPIGKDKITISQVNAGRDYIWDEVAVQLFGWIWDTVEFNDVTIPNNLLSKGKEYLSSVINESITIELSAVDLHYLNKDIKEFKKGDLVRVISIPHKLDKLFMVQKLSLSLDNPKSSKLSLGQTFKTLTQNQVKREKNVILVNEENQKTKKEVSSLKENIKEIDNTVVKIQESYSSKKELQGRCLLKENVKTLNALKAIEDAESGDIHKVLSNNKYYIYINSTWEELVSQAEINSITTQFNNLNTQLNDLIIRVETLEGGGN